MSLRSHANRPAIRTPRRASRWSRSSRFSTLPIALRGRLSTNATSARRWVLPTLALVQAFSAAASIDGVRPQHHEGHRRLAPFLRRHADHGGFEHVGVLGQHRFDVAGIDVEAAGDDHVLLAVHQREKAVGVEPADVAGAHPAVALGIVPEGLGGLLRLVEIALHHHRRAADDLADLALRHELAVLVDQPDLVLRHRLADGVQLVGMLVRQQRAGAAAFGHAVIFDEAAGPALQDVALQFGGERRRGAELHPIRRQIEADRNPAAP